MLQVSLSLQVIFKGIHLISIMGNMGTFNKSFSQVQSHFLCLGRFKKKIVSNFFIYIFLMSLKSVYIYIYLNDEFDCN